MCVLFRNAWVGVVLCHAQHNSLAYSSLACSSLVLPSLSAGLATNFGALSLLPAGIATASDGETVGLGWAGLWLNWLEQPWLGWAVAGRWQAQQPASRAAIVIGSASSCRLLLHVVCVLVQHVA